MKILILSFILILHSTFSLKANDNTCKKFDIKCKTSKFINDAANFQKKGLNKSKEQLKGTKDQVLDAAEKTN